MTRRPWAVLGFLVILPACKSSPPAPLYEKVPVARRDLAVSVSAAGAIEPVLTVDVKSKASGEITEMRVQTGDDVRAGQLLARIDPRLPRNMLAQAQANVEVARAQLQNAQAQWKRADELYSNKMIAETEYENANLARAMAQAEVVRAETELENARDQMADTEIRAPMSGTILQKNVELGTVISSPTRDVAGGTVLFRMANLDTMQVRALVDETDIGKVQAGPEATVRVDAFRNRNFIGRVLKIEPQASVLQNVTMFPVLIGIENLQHLLRPGMNSEVELSVGERRDVLTIPNAALRTERDMVSAAHVLGLSNEEVREQLAAARGAGADSAQAEPQVATAGKATGQTMKLPNGREVTLPAGVSAEQVQAIMAKRMSGGEPTPAERSLLRQVFAGMGGGGPGNGGGGRSDGRGRGAGSRSAVFEGRYVVFAMRSGQPRALEVQTGFTDLDQIEVTKGLSEGDTVLVLPSASLLQQQREFRERFQRVSGGGLPGVQQQQPSGQRPPTR